LFVANYGEGSVATIPIHPDGTLGQAMDSKRHQGRLLPTLSDRQESSHPHMIRQHPVYKDHVLVTDLGLDCIWIYQFETSTGSLQGAAKDKRHVKFPPGAGPRHFDFHPGMPDIVYVHHELNGTTSVLRLKTTSGDNGTQITGAEEIQCISSLKSDVICSRDHHMGGSDIHVSPDGLFLYCLNRTDQTIGIFTIHSNSGELTLNGHVPTLGKVSRNFKIIPGPITDFFVVVNQESKMIVVYKRNKLDGWLTDPQHVITDLWPTCVDALL